MLCVLIQSVKGSVQPCKEAGVKSNVPIDHSPNTDDVIAQVCHVACPDVWCVTIPSVNMSPYIVHTLPPCCRFRADYQLGVLLHRSEKATTI